MPGLIHWPATSRNLPGLAAVTGGCLIQIKPTPATATKLWYPPAAQEISMRRPAWMISSIAVLIMAALGAPAGAQTYDPHYPVCLQTYGISGSGISCRYPSMEACQVSAMGRAAQCIANPYYGQAGSRHRYRAY